MITLRTTSLAALLLLAPPLLNLALWIASWNLAGGVHENAVVLLAEIEMAALLAMALAAVVLSAVAAARRPGRDEARAAAGGGRANLLLLAGSAAIAGVYAFMAL